MDNDRIIKKLSTELEDANERNLQLIRDTRTACDIIDYFRQDPPYVLDKYKTDLIIIALYHFIMNKVDLNNRL